jgi:TcpE family
MPNSDDGRLTIRSYRLCFRLERRIYKIDRFRIPVSWGIPLRSVAYAAGALLAMLVLQRAPALGALASGLHPALRYVILPAAVAYALTQVKVDGRPAHQAAAAWLRFLCRPRCLLGASWRVRPGGVLRLGEIAIAPDERCGRYRRGRIDGPATVLLRYPARGRRRKARLALRQTSARPLGRGKLIALRAGQTLELR